MSNNVSTVLTGEISYYLTLATSHKSVLAGLVTATIGAIATLITLLKYEFVNFSNPSDIIIYYCAINFIGYGVSLLFKWYDLHNNKKIVEKMKDGINQGDVIKDAVKDIEPDDLVETAVMVIVFLTAIITFFTILSKTNFLHNITIILMLIGFISILSGGIISYNKSKGKKTDLDFKGVYKIISNNYIFYPVVFMILSFGIVFVLFHDANGLYIFIAALYIVIFQIILINSLKIYGQYSDCVHKINMLHEIKINMIKEELKDIKYNMLYNNIVFDEKRELLNEKYLNKK